MTVTAFVLWTIYGFVIGSLPIIVFNLLSLVLSGAIARAEVAQPAPRKRRGRIAPLARGLGWEPTPRRRTCRSIEPRRVPPEPCCSTKSGADTIVDPRDAAESAGLTYVSDEEPRHPAQAGRQGLRLRRSRRRDRSRDAATLERIRTLAIPPAWTDVWICPQAQRPHPGDRARRQRPQAVPLPPRLARGARRDEVRAHDRLRAARCRAIRAARRRATWRLRGLPREKVLATVVRLLETTLIRVGNDEYARQNKSYGLTTLRDRTSRSTARELRFEFRGKSGKTLAPAGQRPARRPDRQGAARTCRARSCSSTSTRTASATTIASADVNAYLREITGRGLHRQGLPHLGRHRAGGAGAAASSRPSTREAKAKKNVRARHRGGRRAARQHADGLPQVLRPPGGPRRSYLEGALLLEVKDQVEAELREDLASLKPEEAAVLGLLEARLNRTLGEGVDGAAPLDRKPAKRAPRRSGKTTSRAKTAA